MKFQLLVPLFILFACQSLKGQVCKSIHTHAVDIPILSVPSEEGDEYSWYLNNELIPEANNAQFYFQNKEVYGDGPEEVDYYRCYITNTTGKQPAHRSVCFMVHRSKWSACGFIVIDLKNISSYKLQLLKSTIKTNKIQQGCTLTGKDCGKPTMIATNLEAENLCHLQENENWSCKRISFELYELTTPQTEALKKVLAKNRIPYQVQSLRCPSGNTTRAAKTATNDPKPTTPNTSNVGQ